MPVTEIKKTEKRPLVFIGNRWVNTIYSGYGIVKQRILLQILQAPAIKDAIVKAMSGDRVHLPASPVVGIEIDISNISGYNNYHAVREQLQEMCTTPIQIYNDTTFKGFIYTPAPLLHSVHRGSERKMAGINISREILQLLIHVDYNRAPKAGKKQGPYQFTKFDPAVLKDASSKYMYPLYTKICSYAELGAFTMPIDQLRTWLQVDEKYKGFDNFHRYVLKHVQKECEISGAYGFNFGFKKSGRTVTHVVFKVFANTKYDPNHIWLKIVRALNGEQLPYFARFTEDQREQFNYLLNSTYDLHQVFDKLKNVHKALEKIVPAKGAAHVYRVAFSYVQTAFNEKFPPPS